MTSRSSLRISSRVLPHSTALIVPALLSAAAILSHVEQAQASATGFSLSPRGATAPGIGTRDSKDQENMRGDAARFAQSLFAAESNKEQPTPPEPGVPPTAPTPDAPAPSPDAPPQGDQPTPPAAPPAPPNSDGEEIQPDTAPPKDSAPAPQPPSSDKDAGAPDAPSAPAAPPAATPTSPPNGGGEEIQPDTAPAQPDGGGQENPPQDAPPAGEGGTGDEGEVQMEFGDESQPDGEGEVEMEFGDESQPEGEGEVEMEFGEEAAAGGDEGEVQMEFGEEAAGADAPMPEEDDGGFVFEDISDDPEALAKELQAGQKQAKGVVGTVTGTVTGSDGQPVMGAFIETSDGKFVARAGVDGTYSLKLNPGTYTLTVRFDGFESKEFPGINVQAKAKVSMDAQITPLPGAVQTLIVEEEVAKEGQVGQAIQRQKSRAARDIMSREEMSRSGGSSTSSVARRIVGSTIVGGRYIFVRGLGHRYGNTLMDGARVPSPDPELRTVPLDIFPTSALSAINVQKTATADVPADFAGGSVQLETREIPDYFTLKVGASIGANTQTTFLPMVTNKGFAGPDFFGFGNVKRGLPDKIANSESPIEVGTWDAASQTYATPYDPAEIEKMGESMFSVTRVDDSEVFAPPNLGLDFSVGNSWGLGRSGKLGLLLATGYRNEHETRLGSLAVYSVQDAGVLNLDTPRVSYDTFDTSNQVAWNSIGLAKLKIDDYHKISLSGMYSRDVDDSTRRFAGVSLNVGPQKIVADRLRYIMRSVGFTQLSGSHEFPGLRNLKVEWFGSYSNAVRDDPAIRDLLYNDKRRTPLGRLELETTQGPVRQTYLKLADHTESGAIDLSLPFRQWSQLESLVKVGGWVEAKQREFNARSFIFDINRGMHTFVRESIHPGLEQIIRPDTIGTGPTVQKPKPDTPFSLSETTLPTDNYSALQNIFAGYALFDLPVNYKFKISGGLRAENNVLRVTPKDLFNPDSEEIKSKRSRIREFDLFPSLGLQYKLYDKMSLRLTGARTIARPEMREMAPFKFTDFVGGFETQGNPFLVSTHIWNGDLRWEWFPDPGEVVAVTLFYKHFDNPIESTIASRNQPLSSFTNAKNATNFGFELEGRKNLGFLQEVLRPWTVGFNFAYVNSEVKLPDPSACDAALIMADTSLSEEKKARLLEKCDFLRTFDASTSRKRPLQGQSPFVLNAFLDFEHKKWGTNARILYNTFGRRIYQIGGNTMPDIYEEGVHSVDFRIEQAVYRVPEVIDDEGNIQAPAKALKLKFSASNIFNSPVRFRQGDQKATTRRTLKGVDFSLGLSWSI